jgi:hypothetical protein
MMKMWIVRLMSNWRLKGSVLFQDRDLSDLDLEHPNYLEGWDGSDVEEEQA